MDVYVCKYRIDSNATNSADLTKIGYEKFKTLDNIYGSADNLYLHYIYVENNVIVRIEEQFIP